MKQWLNDCGQNLIGIGTEMIVLLSDTRLMKAKEIFHASSFYHSVSKFLIILQLLSIWLELPLRFWVSLLRLHPQQG